MSRAPRDMPLWDRIAMHSVEDENGCWVWQRARNSDGYGVMGFEGRVGSTHRLSYEAFVGDIPVGLELDHLCSNRACVRPDHLEPVPHAVNIRRGRTGQHNAIKTHCPRNHPYSAENTRPDHKITWRRCKQCDREAAQARRERRQLALADPSP